MRYTKGSQVITAEGDIPLLRQVRNSRFIGHQQLFELLQYEACVSARSTFNWRIQRLLRTRHLERLESVTWQGAPIYSIAPNGLVELESRANSPSLCIRGPARCRTAPRCFMRSN